MNFLFIFVIRCYQLFFPKRFRGKCLYKVSCSNHVLNVTKEKGFVEGLKALQYRYKNCRPNYDILYQKNNTILITVEKNIIEEKDLNSVVLKK